MKGRPRQIFEAEITNINFRRNFEKIEEAEKLRQSLVEVEKKAEEPERLRRAHSDLERVYSSLQHQYQLKEDELERTEMELEEYRAKLGSYENNYFPTCKVKSLFH